MIYETNALSEKKETLYCLISIDIRMEEPATEKKVDGGGQYVMKSSGGRRGGFKGNLRGGWCGR